jgi:hypothetical protein
MPLDLIAPPVSPTTARPDAWREAALRARGAPEPAAAFPLEAATPPSSRSDSRPPASPAAFLAQQLAQPVHDAAGPRPPATARAAYGSTSYQLAESRDPILRGQPILFRFSV